MFGTGQGRLDRHGQAWRASCVLAAWLPSGFSSFMAGIREVGLPGISQAGLGWGLGAVTIREADAWYM